MALLGEDGKGFELARKLESTGVWRSWLGESLYSNFAHSLSSPAAWDSFMSVDDSKSRVQIQLQLRVRALLYDKATISLSIRTPASAASPIVSKLNSNYLQLHGDDVYFTLEDAAQQRDGVVASNSAPAKVHSKASFGTGSRYGESDGMSQILTQEDFPETWYSQFFEKHGASKSYILSSLNWSFEKRSPSEMSDYLKHLEKHKRRRIAFNVDPSARFGNHGMQNRPGMQLGSALDGDVSDDETFFPETMFMNCVPASAIRPHTPEVEKQQVEFYGVLDRLPQVATKSSIMIERLGISVDQGPGQARTKVAAEGNRRRLSHEQALLFSKKATARTLATVGFEGSSEASMEVLSQLLCCHMSKLGTSLKVLTDSYRKKCSATELIRMFLRVAGLGNLATLADYIKDGRNVIQQTPQQLQSAPSQMPMTHQPSLHMPHLQRQVQSQQMIHPQNLTPQQQQQLANLTPQQLANLTPQQQQQLANMTTQQQQHLTNLTPHQQQQLANMTPQQLANLTPQQQQQLANLTPQQLANLTPQQQQQLANLAPQQQQQLGSLTPQQQQQLANLTPQQVANMTPQQQQQLARMRRSAQVSSPRPSMSMDKDRPLVEVKIENTDTNMDSSAFNAMKLREFEMQRIRHHQQQLAAMQRFQQGQPGAQYRQLSSLQMPQMQTPNMGVGLGRAQPVKVEGFQELMGGGGESSSKHDTDEGKFTSPK